MVLVVATASASIAWMAPYRRLSSAPSAERAICCSPGSDPAQRHRLRERRLDCDLTAQECGRTVTAATPAGQRRTSARALERAAAKAGQRRVVAERDEP